MMRPILIEIPEIGDPLETLMNDLHLCLVQEQIGLEEDR